MPRCKPNPPRAGEVFPTTKWGDVEVTEYNSCQDVVVRFKDGTTKRTATKELRKGMVKNNFQPEVAGVGFMGEGQYGCKNGRLSGSCAEYEVWRGMLRRCYDERNFANHPTYEGCTVDVRWHNFQNFAEWYTKQHGYAERWHLDKDFVVMGNKVYSPETCTLLPPDINGIFSGGGKRARGSQPLGVHWCNTKKVFVAQIHRGTKAAQDYLGYFQTAQEAFEVYKVAKEKHIKAVVSKYKGIISDKVFNNLYNHQVLITD